MTQTPHPTLVSLLEQHGLDHTAFRKRGRVPRAVVEARSAIVTHLHEQGVSWQAMMEITGLSNGAIQRLTQAKGCAAAKKNRADNAARVGHFGKGRPKPWLSESLRGRWANGSFDHLRGRSRSSDERAVLRASWTQERRERHSLIRARLWESPAYRSLLEAFHRSPSERARRSHAQAERMAADPEKWTWGRGAWVTGTKHGGDTRFWVRSSHEVAAVLVLEADPNVASYTYEPRFTLPDGTAAIPDFKVHLAGGGAMLVEVKAAWVLALPPNHRKAIRLDQYRDLARAEGIPFEVWTEKDVLHDYL